MPLPTAPAKLGHLLPAEEYKAKARPSKQSKKSAAASDDDAFGAVETVTAERPAANAAHTLRSIASEVLTQIPSGAHAEAAVPPPAPGTVPTRGRKSKQTAALLQPAPAARETPAGIDARAERAERADTPVAPAPSAARDEARAQGKRRKAATAETELRKLCSTPTC